MKRKCCQCDYIGDDVEVVCNDIDGAPLHDIEQHDGQWYCCICYRDFVLATKQAIDSCPDLWCYPDYT
jgi:hypothetical protein